jgi:putative zinc finger protein
MAFDSNRHMADDEIESYSMGVASEEETARFEEHLLICEACQRRVGESDDQVAAMQGAGLRFRERSRQSQNSQPFSRRLPFLGALGLVAAGSMVALVSLGGLRPWLHGASPAFAVNLQATRGAGIEARAPAGRPLRLNLELSGLPVQESYRVEAVDRMGKKVWEGTAPPQDSKAAASLPGMSAGIYFVRVYAPSGELLREYGLNVED